MNAIEEVERIHEIGAIIGSGIPVLSSSTLNRLPNVDLQLLLDLVGNKIHSIDDLDITWNNPALEYYYDICEVMEHRILSESHMEDVLSSTVKRLQLRLS